MSERLLPPAMQPIEVLLDGMLEAAVYAIEETRRARAKRVAQSRPSKGKTLRPGENTPLWNVLRERLQNQTWKRGEKALLARRLGLPRQRISQYLSTGAAMPDAERTLWLLHWLKAREQGKEIPL